jgi:hypothetical protein
MTTTFKIHPAIGISRVGNSEDYYLGPVTAGGLPLEKDGTTAVTSFRDSNGAIRRQAARFQVYIHDGEQSPGAPLTVGQRVDGKTVTRIAWTTHLANKKSAWYEFQQLKGEKLSQNDAYRLKRNPQVTADADRDGLIIDAGPRTAVSASGQPDQTADFTAATANGYPASFPPAFATGQSITTLGKIVADAAGHLDVVGGMGISGCSMLHTLTREAVTTMVESVPDEWDGYFTRIANSLWPHLDIGCPTKEEFDATLRKILGDADFARCSPLIDQIAYQQPRIDQYANNSFWWDDTSDGPVTARIYFDDNTYVDATHAWVLVGPPAYAPEILNMVTLYETMYDAFVRNFNYNPALFADGQFRSTYKPSFASEIQPILSRVKRYQWVANIEPKGVNAHADLGTPSLANAAVIQRILRLNEMSRKDAMPKLAGDNPLAHDASVTPDKPYYTPPPSRARKSTFLVLTPTQRFLLQQYIAGNYVTTAPQDPPASGVTLDRGVLENCVGGPFCPGIEMTWICRHPEIYAEPFRIKLSAAYQSHPGGGLHWGTEPLQGDGLEPGDVTKFMALPWQADFNECASQTIDGDPSIQWWPAQRPFYITYGSDDDTYRAYWTRLRQDQDDTDSTGEPFNAFVHDEWMVANWRDLGFIKKGDGDYAPFLEVERRPELSVGQQLQVPGAPRNLRAFANKYGVLLKFDPPGDNGGSPITQYTATLIDLYSGDQARPTTTGPSSPLLIVADFQSATYGLSVTATNGVGTGAAAEIPSIDPGALVPYPPMDVVVTPGDGQAVVTFTPQQNPEIASPVEMYIAISDPDGVVAYGPSSPLVVKGLTNGKPYRFNLYAAAEAGLSNPRESSPVTPRPAPAPGAPTNVTAAPSDRQATVTFEAPQNKGGSDIQYYTVTAVPVPSGTVNVIDDGQHVAYGASSPITVEHLSNGQAYRFNVTATNATGTSAASAPSEPVTPSHP